jgi:hypothetical protein
MVIMQARIDIQGGHMKVHLDLLRREDASDQEYRLAKAMEHVLLGVLDKAAKDGDAEIEREFIGEDTPNLNEPPDESEGQG